MAIVIIAGANWGIREMAHVAPHINPLANVPHISQSRVQHILYGDAHGGGHMHGMNRPCKSEFPADWDADKILATIMKDAANENLNWRHESNGNDVADVNESGITIRIVVNARHSEIITAYPTSTPRNACAANDNGD